MTYIPERDKTPLKGATILLSNYANVVFERRGKTMKMTAGTGFLYSANALEELADGLRQLAADMREDAVR